jgi:hypothetical protein
MTDHDLRIYSSGLFVSLAQALCEFGGVLFLHDIDGAPTKAASG